MSSPWVPSATFLRASEYLYSTKPVLDNVAATSPQAGGIVSSTSPGVPQPSVPCGPRVSHRPVQSVLSSRSPNTLVQQYQQQQQYQQDYQQQYQPST
ncbi:hypothetical protein V8F20_010555 [Naviculisporaceae sp. PSN 640]